MDLAPFSWINPVATPAWPPWTCDPGGQQARLAMSDAANQLIARFAGMA
jgi:hypothetical protein